MGKHLTRFALLVVSVALPGLEAKADTPAANVKATFKIYDKDGSLVADVNKAIPKHTNAFDALRRTLSVDFDTYPGPLGIFITAIVGISQSPADNLYWMLYVDGPQSQLGISNFYIEKDTLIEFKLEKPKGPSLRAGQKVTVHAHIEDAEGKVLHRHKLELTVSKAVPLK